MAKNATKTPAGRVIESAPEKPKHLISRSGPGRTRQATEFDELVPDWYESGDWKKIPAQGETAEEQLEDVEEVYKAVHRAVSFHGLGCSRIKETDPEDPEFSGYGVWVHVRERQERPRKAKSENDTGDVEGQESFDEMGDVDA